MGVYLCPLIIYRLQYIRVLAMCVLTLESLTGVTFATFQPACKKKMPVFGLASLEKPRKYSNSHQTTYLYILRCPNSSLRVLGRPSYLVFMGESEKINSLESSFLSCHLLCVPNKAQMLHLCFTISSLVENELSLYLNKEQKSLSTPLCSSAQPKGKQKTQTGYEKLLAGAKELYK